MNKHTQELQHNELVDWLEAKFGHLRPYAGKIGLAALALVALGVVFAFYLRARHEVIASQWQRLHLALTESERVDGQTRHFTEYADEFPDEMASLWAWQMAGDRELHAGIQLLISQWDEGRRHLDRAKKLYQRILDSSLNKTSLLLERANFGMAYALESLGEFEDAKSFYQKIIDEAPESAFVTPARQALDRLSKPEWIAFHSEYYKIGMAPGLVLPNRPDISFPDLDAEASEPTPPTEATAPPAEGGGTNQSDQTADESDGSDLAAQDVVSRLVRR